MKIISWNVNGLRAINKKGFKEFVKQYDIVAIQEAKAQIEDLKKEDYEIDGYSLVWHQAQKKGYSGTAIWIKNGISFKAQQGLGIDEFDNEGRTTIIELDNYIIYNGYFPNGKEDHSRVAYKLRYSYAVLEWAKKQTKPVIISGDLNTAHRDIDLRFPKQNQNSTGFLLIERKFLDDLEKSGYIDIIRKKNPNGDMFSWWSYRFNDRSNNNGWRIDYFWIDSKILSIVLEAYNLMEQLGSDHCPIYLELKDI